jgi:glycosyltransferase involved in cell wall biosynthesis
MTYVSVVIPARNEAESLPDLLESIARHLGPLYDHEVIVVDNGSTDSTVAIANRYHAKVLVNVAGTVALLRNCGVVAARGNILIFLDADMELTGAWSNMIRATIEMLEKDTMIVTGSRAGVPDHCSWIQRYWFDSLKSMPARYINSGHMITTLTLFQMLGGFDAKLETGEDYDFGRRAFLAGARIINNPALAVIHHGYPKLLLDFIRREVWHGKGDFYSLASFKHSKIAQIAVVFLMLHLLALWGLCIGSLVVTAASVATLLAFCTTMSAIKFHRQTGKVIVVNAYLYYWYFIGRLGSIVAIMQDVLSKRS